MSAADPAQVYPAGRAPGGTDPRLAGEGRSGPAPRAHRACSVQGAGTAASAPSCSAATWCSRLLVRDPRLDYVALGHIHKPQNLNENAHPPVIYPGSIERVDFGEVDDDKFFVIAHVERGRTKVEWRKLKRCARSSTALRRKSQEDVTGQICRASP